MCSGSEAGSYLRFIDGCITLGLRVIKKRRRLGFKEHHLAALLVRVDPQVLRNHLVQDIGFRIPGSGLRVQDIGFRIFGFRISCSGCRGGECEFDTCLGFAACHQKIIAGINLQTPLSVRFGVERFGFQGCRV